MSLMTKAQNTTGISGLYNLGSSSPEGGSHLFVLGDGHYAITYFGGFQFGTWVNTKENVYKFSPDLRASNFELFGRYNKALKGKTKVSFSGFENGETFVQLRTSEEEAYTMRRVFNTGANCFSPPYVYTFNTIANAISMFAFQFEEHDTTAEIISFENPEGYNDFVANFVETSHDEAQPLIAIFKDDKLLIEEHKPMERIPLEEVGEDIEFIKRLIDQEQNRDTLYLNPSYNSFFQTDDVEEEGQRDLHEHHVFDQDKNAFIDREYYVEGSENTPSEEAYEDMSIIFSYLALKAMHSKFVKYKLIEKPLFEVNCD